MGYEVRKEIPACVKARIIDTFPPPNAGELRGFQNVDEFESDDELTDEMELEFFKQIFADLIEGKVSHGEIQLHTVMRQLFAAQVKPLRCRLLTLTEKPRWHGM